eukprot:CAMPEP_0173059954 /NCGR_PEP_ID=MMETSP1102-20130122/2307_1 /TAXON_ID=49646 /ORGANISM="Geminigera sp., Strain Caron Lab Isolate" /LENGTH=183 /DNA_ID=CAMNT_0013926087 /DNA_START=439 /DNA_END=990 /DNA_ORIENTATION=+
MASQAAAGDLDPQLPPRAGSFSGTPTPAGPGSGEKKKIGMLKAMLSKKEIARAETAESQLQLSQSQLVVAENTAVEAVEQKRLLEQAVQKQAVELENATNQMTIYQQEFESLKTQLASNTELAVLEKEKASLELAAAKKDLSQAILERDEAVCAATRAMMVPELEGEEFEALLSVLQEDDKTK